VQSVRDPFGFAQGRLFYYAQDDNLGIDVSWNYRPWALLRRAAVGLKTPFAGIMVIV